MLISNYLKKPQTPQAYLQNLLCSTSNYNGFNLLIGDQNNLFYLSNYQLKIINIPPGIHGLSNHLLNTPWPKISYGKKRFKSLLDQSRKVVPEDLFMLLSDDTLPEDSQLPHTGIGIAWERILSPMFIHSPNYGTRCSSIILIEQSGRIHFHEKTYPPELQNGVSTFTRAFSIEC
jgi:uncharacterized protein with NRDE domain